MTQDGKTHEDGEDRLAVAKLLLSRFRGREDHVAVGHPDGSFAPQKLTCSLKPEWLAIRHLSGQQCLGFYLMTPGSRVWCSCVDFDNKAASPDPDWQTKSESVAVWLEKAGLSPVVEVSASGAAAHVWLFFDEATEAWVVRGWWAIVSRKTGIAFKEVYPRQDALSGKGLGNLVRYPLWGQSRFVDLADEWKPTTAADALANVGLSNRAELLSIAYQMGEDIPAPEPESPPDAPGATQASAGPRPAPALSARVQSRLKRSGSLLARRWRGDVSGMRDGSRSSLAQAIACEFVRQYVPTPEIESALRHWCAENGYEKGDRDDWITRTVSKAYEFTFGRLEERSGNVVQMRDACHTYLDQLEKGKRQHVSSGVPELDASVDGGGFGEMVVIAARPGHGKSAFACQWVDRAAAAGLSCLIVSEEMSATELGKRALLSFSNVHPEQWSPESVPVLRQQVDAHYVKRAQIHVVENCHSIDRCEDVVDQFCGINGVRLVAVDYLQLLSSRGGATRYEQVSDVSRRLKQSAKRNQCVMLALCQLNRDIDSRDGHSPQLSDLRDSGQLEQDADLVLFLQWPYRYDDRMHENSYRISIRKRRNGPIRTSEIDTTFYPEFQRFGSMPQGMVPGEVDEWSVE